MGSASLRRRNTATAAFVISVGHRVNGEYTNGGEHRTRSPRGNREKLGHTARGIASSINDRSVHLAPRSQRRLKLLDRDGTASSSQLLMIDPSRRRRGRSHVSTLAYNPRIDIRVESAWMSRRLRDREGESYSCIVFQTILSLSKSAPSRSIG